jgi:hypothetical protein
MVNDVILDVQHCDVSSCEDECVVLDLLSGPIGTQVQHRCPFPHLHRHSSCIRKLSPYLCLSLTLSLALPLSLFPNPHTHTHTGMQTGTCAQMHSSCKSWDVTVERAEPDEELAVQSFIVESARTQTCQHRLHRSCLWPCPPPTAFPYG